MRIPMIFIIIVILAFLFRHNVSRVFKRDAEREEAFWERETEANNVRKKPLDDLHYITIPINSLPFFSGIDEKLENMMIASLMVIAGVGSLSMKKRRK